MLVVLWHQKDLQLGLQILAGEAAFDRNIYGPYLMLLTPDVLAAVTLQGKAAQQGTASVVFPTFAGFHQVMSESSPMLPTWHCHSNWPAVQMQMEPNVFH